MYRIAQIGSFDVENFGDLLFPDILNCYLSDTCVVDLYSPKGGIKCFDDKEVFPIKTLSKRIKNYDAIIIGGGDVIRSDSQIFIKNDVYGYTSEPSLELWAYPIMMAKKNGIPVIFNAAGVTHDFEVSEVPLIKKILSYVDYFSVRDTEAQKTLEKIGVFSSKIVPDTVLSISKFFKKDQLNGVYGKILKEGLIPEIDNYIVLQHNSTNVDNPEYYEDLINFVKHVSTKHNVLLMPIGYIHDDFAILSRIYEEDIENVYIVNNKRKLTPIEMISILSNSDGYIGTSMHGGVVSSSYNKKIMFLNSMNSKKLHGFSNVIGKSYLDVNNSKNLIYVYDNFFDKQENADISGCIKKINSHFKDIINLISNYKSVKDDSFVDLSSYMQYFYKEKNNFELIGQYSVNGNFLDRKIFEYDYSEDVFTYKFESDVAGTMCFYPSINKLICVKCIMVNSNAVSCVSNYFGPSTFLSIDVKKGKNVIKIVFDRFVSDFEIANGFKGIDYCSHLEKQVNTLEQSYIELEKKYCQLLKK